MVDDDRGVRGVAWRVRYVSWNDSSDCDGGVVGVVGDCGGGNGEGGGGDADGVGACFGVDGGSGGTRWTWPAEVVFEVGVWWMAGGGGVGGGGSGAAAERIAGFDIHITKQRINVSNIQCFDHGVRLHNVIKVDVPFKGWFAAANISGALPIARYSSAEF